MASRNRALNSTNTTIWTQQEEEYLRTLREELSINSWKIISQQITKNFPNKMSTSKQCRERYINHIKLKLKRASNQWDSKDQCILMSSIQSIGLRWRFITDRIPGRSENQIKNKFYGSIRKMIRTMNSIGRKLIKNYNKPIKYESLMRIIGANQKWKFQSHLGQLAQVLKTELLNLVSKEPQSILEGQWLDIINKIHDFNMKTRNYRLKKSKKVLDKSAKNNAVFEDLSDEPAQISKSIYQDWQIDDIQGLDRLSSKNSDFQKQLNNLNISRSSNSSTNKSPQIQQASTSISPYKFEQFEQELYRIMGKQTYSGPSTITIYI